MCEGEQTGGRADNLSAMMDGEHGGGGGDPSEIPGLTGKTIARAGYVEWSDSGTPVGDPGTKAVRGVRLDLVGGDQVHMMALESIHVHVNPPVFPWLAKMPPGRSPIPSIPVAAVQMKPSLPFELELEPTTTAPSAETSLAMPCGSPPGRSPMSTMPVVCVHLQAL